ncbi:MAG: beta-ketoacyl synthase N-terminal-like domain-containing protein [Bacteroidales bacterium]
MRRFVVTSIGALTSLGKNLHEYWEGLKNGVSGSELITRFDKEKIKTKFACEVKGYDSGNYFDRKETNKLDMYSQFVI